MRVGGTHIRVGVRGKRYSKVDNMNPITTDTEAWTERREKRTYGISLVAEKVNVVFVLVEELQAVGLVPADGEGVEADLAADRVLEVHVLKLLGESLDHGGADLVNLCVWCVCYGKKE